LNIMILFRYHVGCARTLINKEQALTINKNAYIGKHPPPGRKQKPSTKVRVMAIYAYNL